MSLSHILHSIKQFFISFITLISLLLSSTNHCETSYDARDPDKLITSFSVVSDTHVETTDANAYNTFIKLLQGVNSGKNINATVFLGDNVMNGQFFENLLFYPTVKSIMKDKINLVALGNHDVGNGKGDYNEMLKNFLSLNSNVLDNEIDKPYYYRIIKGCYMIFLASEDLSVHSSIISDEQYEWLKGVLDEAAEKNAPIFVFNHHPITLVDGIEWYSLIELLDKYNNLLYFCGHTHMELSEYSFRNVLGINSIYLPRSVGLDYDAGDGVVVEVYEDKILVRSRNFIKGEWIKDLEYEYSLT